MAGRERISGWTVAAAEFDRERLDVAAEGVLECILLPREMSTTALSAAELERERFCGWLTTELERDRDWDCIGAEAEFDRE